MHQVVRIVYYVPILPEWYFDADYKIFKTNKIKAHVEGRLSENC